MRSRYRICNFCTYQSFLFQIRLWDVEDNPPAARSTTLSFSNQSSDHPTPQSMNSICCGSSTLPVRVRTLLFTGFGRTPLVLHQILSFILNALNEWAASTFRYFYVRHRVAKRRADNLGRIHNYRIMSHTVDRNKVILMGLPHKSN